MSHKEKICNKKPNKNRIERKKERPAKCLHGLYNLYNKHSSTIVLEQIN